MRPLDTALARSGRSSWTAYRPLQASKPLEPLILLSPADQRQNRSKTEYGTSQAGMFLATRRWLALVLRRKRQETQKTQEALELFSLVLRSFRRRESHDRAVARNQILAGHRTDIFGRDLLVK